MEIEFVERKMLKEKPQAGAELGFGKLSAAAVLLALGLGCVVYLLYHFWGGGQE